MNILHPIYHFFRYKCLAVNEHGVHSPFVFRLVNNVLYNDVAFYAYERVEAVRAAMKTSGEQLNCVDLGAGSKTGARTVRKVRSLAKYSVKPAKYAQLLFRLANYFETKKMLEIGSSLGITSAYLALANTSGKLISLEGCPEILRLAEQNIRQLEISNVCFIEGNFDDTLPPVLASEKQIDLVFIDGNHRKESTLRYFRQCLDCLSDEGLIVVDDIYWSPEMTAAWEEIKKHPAVTVTVDLYQMGLVFKRPEQAKENFVLRF